MPLPVTDHLAQDVLEAHEPDTRDEDADAGRPFRMHMLLEDGSYAPG